MSRFRKSMVKELKIVGYNQCPKGFYQYALQIEDVINHFNKLGFTLESKLLRNGIRGLKDAYPNSHMIDIIYNNSSNRFFFKFFRHILSTILAYIGFGHTCLLVFKKNKV